MTCDITRHVTSHDLYCDLVPSAVVASMEQQDAKVSIISGPGIRLCVCQCIACGIGVQHKALHAVPRANNVVAETRAVCDTYVAELPVCFSPQLDGILTTSGKAFPLTAPVQSPPNLTVCSVGISNAASFRPQTPFLLVYTLGNHTQSSCFSMDIDAKVYLHLLFAVQEAQIGEEAC